MLDRIFGGDSFIANIHALDAASLRHQVIANNLANATTPNYKRQDVSFESQLKSALDRRDSPFAGLAGTSVGSVQAKVITVNSTSERADGNNVDLETENANLATNTLRYEALTQMVGGYFTGLKAVISGR